MSMNELEAKVAELCELRRMADELAAEITATEDTLKAYMTANGADELHVVPASKSHGTRSPAAVWTAKPSRPQPRNCGSVSPSRSPLAASSWHKKSPLHHRRPKPDAKSLTPPTKGRHLHCRPASPQCQGGIYIDLYEENLNDRLSRPPH